MSRAQTPELLAHNSSPSVEEVATVASAADLFVFRRVGPRRFAHIGGVGCGVGWAGIVTIGLSDEPLFAAALESGAVGRHYRPVPWHVVGPYYGRAAVIVRVSDDVVTVFGSPEPDLLELDDDEFRALAACASDALGEVAPAKRLADELEVVNAIRDLLVLGAGSLAETLQGVVDHAREALSCDVGVLSVREPRRIAISDPAGRLRVEPGELCEVMEELDRRSEFPICVQDALATPLPAPFAPEDGVLAYYLLELREPLSGVMLLVHNDAAPRGFTLLCQSLGLRLVEAAGVLFETALARDALREQLERSNRDARRDALTGLANRRAWEEAMSRFVCSGPAASIVQLDCRNLKQANETYGRDVGDRLLCRVAEIVRVAVSEGALVARIGGDEFAILLVDTDEEQAAALVERIAGALAGDTPIEGSLQATAVIGAATTRDGNLVAAQKAADTRVREAKRLALAG